MNARSSPLVAVVDLAFLGVLIAGGAFAGAAAGHAIGTAGLLCAYGGASMFVGFGLMNRIVRGSMFCVVGPVGFFIALVLALAVGYFALPAVVIWRFWRVFAAISRVAALRPAYNERFAFNA